jgi:hypothetical protein
LQAAVVVVVAVAITATAKMLGHTLTIHIKLICR